MRKMQYQQKHTMLKQFILNLFIVRGFMFNNALIQIITAINDTYEQTEFVLIAKNFLLPIIVTFILK